MKKNLTNLILEAWQRTKKDCKSKIREICSPAQADSGIRVLIQESTTILHLSCMTTRHYSDTILPCPSVGIG